MPRKHEDEYEEEDERPRRRRPENRDEDEEDDRPRRRRPENRDEDEEDDRPRRRRPPEDDEYEEEDDRPRRRRRPQMSDADLRSIAWSQKIILLCILGELATFLATIPLRLVLSNLGPTLELVANLGLLAFYLVVGITATVFVFMMALKLYNTGLGVFLGILTLIPCLGLIVLLIVNSKATSVLQLNGVRVGLLGAKMSDLP